MRLAGASLVLELYVPMVLVGAGMGLTITSTTIAVQDEMQWRRRGVATALIQFTRTVGGMVAVTLVGSLITSWFAADMGPRLPKSLSAAELLDPDRWAELSPRTTSLASDALGSAIRRGFIGVAGLALVVVLVHLGFPALRM
jgi:MFS family permease